MLRQELNQSQKVNMNLNLRMAIDLLTKNSYDLVDVVNKEAETNVFVEFIDKDAIRNSKRNNGYSNQTPNIIEDTEIQKVSLEEKLMLQLLEYKLDDASVKVGRYIINSLDEKGFFKESTDELAFILDVDENRIREVLKIIQSFEPKGIATRNFTECLICQTDDEMLKTLIKNHINDLADNSRSYIIEAMNISNDKLEELVRKLKTLSPYPKIDLNEEKVEYIVPEVFVRKSGDNLIVEIEDRVEVKINNTYIDLIEDAKTSDKRYLRNLLYRANYLKKAIITRATNVRKVSQAIVEYQKEFFYYNSELKPLNMLTIAEICGISQASVSRITSNKYLEFENRLYNLKDFFPPSINFNDDQITPNQVKKMIAEIVSLEDKSNPYSDQKIEERLNQNGVEIKRRTVSKYRTELGIGSKFERKII